MQFDHNLIMKPMYQIDYPYVYSYFDYHTQRHTAQLREELMKLKPTKILQDESKKTLQEKSATSPAAAAADEPAVEPSAAASSTNSDPAPPLTENGSMHIKLVVADHKPVVQGVDPLGVGELENMHNGAEDEAGIY